MRQVPSPSGVSGSAAKLSWPVGILDGCATEGYLFSKQDRIGEH
jgi:hypothetical protein